MLCSPCRYRVTRWASWRGLSFGCFPRSLPLAFATRMPSLVRSRIRSNSNSATMASTLNSSRPTGSCGSYTDPPRLSRTWRTVSSSAIARASGSERASRSSLVTTKVSPSPTSGQRLPQPGALAVGASQTVVDVKPSRIDPQSEEPLALDGQVLGVGRHSRVADQQRHGAPPWGRPVPSLRRAGHRRRPQPLLADGPQRSRSAAVLTAATTRSGDRTRGLGDTRAPAGKPADWPYPCLTESETIRRWLRRSPSVPMRTPDEPWPCSRKTAPPSPPPCVQL